MKNKECSNPNCRLLATRQHPKTKNEIGLCDEHFNELLSVMEKRTPIITLTNNEP